MSCLAGISGKAEHSDCARKTMEFGGFTGFIHFCVGLAGAGNIFLVADLDLALSCPVHLLRPKTRIEISGFWLCVPAPGCRSDLRWAQAAYLDRYPLLEAIYRAKQALCYLLLKKRKNRQQCARLAPRLIRLIEHLKSAGSPPLVQLGLTLESWSDEIACMWRFTRNNSITEGFHNKMETINRQAYGYRSFENYRQRVLVVCA